MRKSGEGREEDVGIIAGRCAQTVVDGFFFFPPIFLRIETGFGGGAAATGVGLAATAVAVPVAAAFFSWWISLTVALTARYRLYSGPSSLWISESRPVVVFFLSSFVPVACFAPRNFFISSMNGRFFSCARDFVKELNGLFPV